MALHEQDREDLIREGRGLPIRGELLVEQNEVFIGFRGQDQASFYLNQSTVWQFNSLAELRRAYWNGARIAAYDRALQRLTPIERGGRLSLQRDPLPVSDADRLLRELSDFLVQLRDFLAHGRVTWRGAVPDAEIVMQTTNNWFARFSGSIILAAAPNAC